VVNGAAVSKTFQILYRNEEVHLDDHVLFKLHVIVDSHKLVQTNEKHLLLICFAAWPTSQAYSPNSRECISSHSLGQNIAKCHVLGFLPIKFAFFELLTCNLNIICSLWGFQNAFTNGFDFGRFKPALWLMAKSSAVKMVVLFGSLYSPTRCSG
ncbi:unnamed protein product, partial [Meganyctiphanes norvegica]